MSGNAIVYSNDCPVGLKRLTTDSTFIWQCDGTADQAEINAAINAVQATGQTSTTKPTGGGGTVLLVGGTFNINAPIFMQSWVDIGGAYGRAGTHINAVSGFTGTGMIMTGQTYTEMTTVHDLYIDGKNIGTAHGVYYNAQTTQTPFTYADPVHTARDLVIMNSGGAGMYFDTAVRVSTVERVRIGTPATYGFYGGGFVDSMLSNVQILGAGTIGAYLANTDNSFNSLRVDNSHQSGIQISGTRQTFTNCQVEDSSQHNWLITVGKVALVGCAANSAGLGTPGTYDGFNIASVSNLSMTGCQSYDRNGTPNQRYGVYLVGTCTNSRITCSTYGNATGSFGGTTTPGSGSVYDVYGT